MRWHQSSACGTTIDRKIQYFGEYAEQLYKEVLGLKVTATELMETASSKLKDELCDGIAVKLSNSDKAFVVEPDASAHALGAVQLQSELEEE